MINYFKTKLKYIILGISLAFLALGIYHFQAHISEIGLKPYSNVSSNKMTSEEVFLLHVSKTSRVFLLHNAVIGNGYVEFKLLVLDGQIIDKYRLTSDSFINRAYNLKEGVYQCTINRDVEKNRESFRFYYDRRFITQEYIKYDSKTNRNQSSN